MTSAVLAGLYSLTSMVPIQDAPLKLAIVLPPWQVAIILVGFPLLYLANSYTPWSKGLFVNHDHNYYIPFLSSILLLHWVSVAMLVIFISRAGGHLQDIGMQLSPGKVAMNLGMLAAIGTALVLVRQNQPASYHPTHLPATVSLLLPVTLGERGFWMLTSLSAGICEELIYRGFGICALRGIGVPTWMAVPLAAIAFVLIHGLWGLHKFWFYFVIGLLYSGLFLWLRSLTPGIWIHTLHDMVFILAG